MIVRQANEMSIFQKRILNLQILFFPPQNWVCLFILMFLKNRVRRSYSRNRITKRKYSILIWTFAHHSRSSVFLLVIQFLLYNLRTQFFKILRINKLFFVGKKIRICRFRIRFWKIRSSWNMESDMNCWTWTIRAKKFPYLPNMCFFRWYDLVNLWSQVKHLYFLIPWA